MGRTSKPRTLLVTDESLRASAEIQVLAAKGHTILAWEQAGNMIQPDLILGPNCRMVTPETVKYVGLALKELGAARKVLDQQILVASQQEALEGDDE